MAFASISPFGFSLAQSGIRYVLMPQDVPATVTLENLYGLEQAPHPAPPRSYTPRPAPVQRQYKAPPPKYRPSPSTHTPPPPPPVVQPLMPKQTVMAQWPKEWQDLFARTKPGWLVWTYWDLGFDLCGQAQAHRRALLQQFLKKLARPAGTNCFWPLGLPQQGVIQPEPEIFWQGVRALGGRLVIVMGMHALTALNIPPAPQEGFIVGRSPVPIVWTKDINELHNEKWLHWTVQLITHSLQRLPNKPAF